MKNPIVARLLELRALEPNHDASEIIASYKLSEKIRKALDTHAMKCEYHFSIDEGKLVCDKLLGRDENDDFYSAENGNFESRSVQIKGVIVEVLLAEYNA